MKWHWYEGNVSGWALILPPGEVGHKADLLVFAEDTGASSIVPSVPRREKADIGPKGAGHTFRDEK
jgi:hypothetical protein